MLLCRASKKGHILIVSSLSGFVPLPGQTAYSATKFALRVRALCSLVEWIFSSQHLDRSHHSVLPFPGNGMLLAVSEWHVTCLQGFADALQIEVRQHIMFSNCISELCNSLACIAASWACSRCAKPSMCESSCLRRLSVTHSKAMNSFKITSHAINLAQYAPMPSTAMCSSEAPACSCTLPIQA